MLLLAFALAWTLCFALAFDLAFAGAAEGEADGAAEVAPVCADAGVEITARGIAKTIALARMDRNFFMGDSN